MNLGHSPTTRVAVLVSCMSLAAVLIIGGSQEEASAGFILETLPDNTLLKESLADVRRDVWVMSNWLDEQRKEYRLLLRGDIGGAQAHLEGLKSEYAAEIKRIQGIKADHKIQQQYITANITEMNATQDKLRADLSNLIKANIDVLNAPHYAAAAAAPAETRPVEGAVGGAAGHITIWQNPETGVIPHFESYKNITIHTYKKIHADITPMEDSLWQGHFEINARSINDTIYGDTGLYNASDKRQIYPGLADFHDFTQYDPNEPESVDVWDRTWWQADEAYLGVWQEIWALPPGEYGWYLRDYVDDDTLNHEYKGFINVVELPPLYVVGPGCPSCIAEAHLSPFDDVPTSQEWRDARAEKRHLESKIKNYTIQLENVTQKYKDVKKNTTELRKEHGSKQYDTLVSDTDKLRHALENARDNKNRHVKAHAALADTLESLRAAHDIERAYIDFVRNGISVVLSK